MRTITRVAIVAGEDSGDVLGAGLISAMRARFPNCRFEGIGGERMITQGFHSHYPLDRLAVMGFVEPLKRLPELLSIRGDLKRRYTQDPPDVFVGIDAPDFNLSLEAALRKKGIRTVHYVSPSVWAWRQGRIKKIARAVDLMLTLFPFEAEFYTAHKVPVEFVGHPLADDIALENPMHLSRAKLGLDPDTKYLALLPGSRKSEVEKLAPVFFDAARRCLDQDPSLKFLVPAANASRYQEILAILQNFPELDVKIQEGGSHDMMASANLVLITSGTTTLEALLLKKPTVIGYRVAALTYWILKRLVTSRFIGLPNLLAGRELMPEFVQNDMTAENLTASLMEYLRDDAHRARLYETCVAIHKSLRKNASESAAEAIVKLWSQA